MEVIVRRSKKRKKTIEARIVKGALEVLAPISLSDAVLQDYIARMSNHLERRKSPRDDAYLRNRAHRLNVKYFGGMLSLKGIEYSKRQERRRGSCNSHTKIIRISRKLSIMPQWVEDYVIVHELSHLLEPNHGKRFKKLEERYPLAERAKGFLIATETFTRNQ
jgi:predicted metal-dependent hydrolase